MGVHNSNDRCKESLSPCQLVSNHFLLLNLFNKQNRSRTLPTESFPCTNMFLFKETSTPLKRQQVIVHRNYKCVSLYYSKTQESMYSLIALLVICKSENKEKCMMQSGGVAQEENLVCFKMIAGNAAISARDL